MRIACWQTRSGGSGADLLARLTSISRTAAAAGADLLITPELSLTGYGVGLDRPAKAAEPVGGPLHDAVSRLAAEAGIAIVYGWPETAGGTVYNSVQLIDARGETAAHYRKTHLYGEFDTAAFTAGSRPLVQADLGGVRVGLVICYDVEFPELVRMHALAGTQLLAVPTALVRPWTFVPRVLIPARAFESQLFIAYVNWSGPEPAGYCGLSRVAGPDGELIAADETGTPEALLVAELDLTEIAAARRATPYLADRRPELYGGLT